MTAAVSVMHHRMIGLIVVAIGLADMYGLHPLVAPLGLMALGLYGFSFPFEGPEDVTHTLFSALAVAGGIFEGWRRSVAQERWVWVSQSVLVLAAGFLVFHRHGHHQSTFVTMHHGLFAMTLILLAWLYHRTRQRGMTVCAAGVILMFYFID